MLFPAALLGSWDRQARIVRAVVGRIDASNRHQKPSPDGWNLEIHLAHIHHVRRFWLHQLDPDRASALPKTIGDDWVTPTADLTACQAALDTSAAALRAALAEKLHEPLAPAEAYDNPVLFLQHMIWHEGWHVGLLMLGLRRAGQEPDEAWDEAHLWGEWRTE